MSNLKMAQKEHRDFQYIEQTRPEYDFPVLVKRPSTMPVSTQQLQQLKNEYDISKKLAGVDGIEQVLAIEGDESKPTVLIRKVEGQSLATYINNSPFNLADRLDIAQQIATILNQVHQKGIMHKAISPASILINEDRKPTLIDFSRASTLLQEEPEDMLKSKATAAAVRYMSPEQTGRMNRLVDQRTDIYSLGVTFYELFTGQPFFQTNDILEMIYYHLAREPEIDNPELPKPVEGIILKLLAKNADERYQSAAALDGDLRICLDQWQTKGTIDHFDLASKDKIGKLQIPDKLYGRQQHINQLLSTFAQASQGAAELLLVKGYSGVGKTALVHEIHKHVVAQRGVFGEGKFDQNELNIPYHAWRQALAKVVNNWLAESREQIEGRSQSILKAVGQNGQLLLDLIPNLEPIIGPQPEIVEISSEAAQNRFHHVLQCFFGAAAKPEQPLVLFLDDVQWIDPASLELLKFLFLTPDIHHILVIVAYRDDEAGATHPLNHLFKSFADQDVIPKKLTLSNLDLADTTHLLLDYLYSEPHDVTILAELVQAKTDGNPFFIQQFLSLLTGNNMLYFDTQREQWQWDIEAIKQLTVSDNVVDLMVSQLQSLPPATRRLLEIGACVGNVFDLLMISAVSPHTSAGTLQQQLQPALQNGYLIRQGDRFHFAHDRVQEAAYSEIPRDEKAAIHWRLGRSLQLDLQITEANEQYLEMVNHLNRGQSAAPDETDTLFLANMNRAASQKAYTNSAFKAALLYAQTGINQLPLGTWKTAYRLTLDLHLLAANSAFLTQQFMQCESLIDTILEQGQSLLDVVPAYKLQITLYYNLQRINESIETGTAVLEQLGTPLVDSLSEEFSLQSFIDLPPMTDPQAVAAMELLDVLMVGAYIASPDFVKKFHSSMLNLTLRFGAHPLSYFAIGVLGLFTWPDDIPLAIEYGKLATKKVTQSRITNLIPRVNSTTESFLLPWETHFSNLLDRHQASKHQALQNGDNVVASAFSSRLVFLKFLLAEDLSKVENSILEEVRFLEGIGLTSMIYIGRVGAQFVSNLLGHSTTPYLFNGPIFSEAGEFQHAQSAGYHRPVFYAHLLKGILNYHLGNTEAACAVLHEAQSLRPGMQSLFPTALLPFYQSLAILRLSEVERTRSQQEQFSINLKEMQRWSKSAPMNFAHEVALLQAEQARINGDLAQAIAQYEIAISSAKEQGYRRTEALANELYGRFWLGQGNYKIAELYLQEAITLYDQWGAQAIVDHLQAEFSQWLTFERLPTNMPPAPHLSEEVFSQIDLLAVLRMSQTISTELNYHKLLSQLMQIIMENAGAQRGFLLLEENSRWYIQASAETDKIFVHDRQSRPVEDNELLAISIVRYVANSKKTIILTDATRNIDFSQDRYIQGAQIKSLLCLPLSILNREETGGILYLENNLAAGVFDPERVALLELLSSQMAISLENARLYDQLEELVAARTQALTLAESQFDTLFHNSPLGVGMSTKDGRVLGSNQALYDMMGFNKEELSQYNVSHFYENPDKREELLSFIQQESAVNDFGVKLLRRDGSAFYANLHVSKLQHQGEDVLLTIIEDVSEQIAAEEALRTSLEQAAVDAERSRLARELHDSVTQSLFSTTLFAQAGRKGLQAGNIEGAEHYLKRILDTSHQALKEMRLFIYDLLPEQLAQLGLVKAIQQRLDTVEKRAGINVDFQHDLTESLPKAVNEALYRIAQEALNNSLKHGDAANLTILLVEEKQQIHLKIADDGLGFDLEEISNKGGIGLQSMRDRVEQLNGEFVLQSKPGLGTKITVRLKVPS